MRKIQKKRYGDNAKGMIPKVKDFGSIIVADRKGNKKLYLYFVMQRYEKTLHQLFFNKKMSSYDIIDISIQMLKVLEIMHESGYVHNDLKLDNIMIG